MLFNSRVNILYHALLVSQQYCLGISNVKVLSSNVDYRSSWDWTTCWGHITQPYHLHVSIDIVIMWDHMSSVNRLHDPYLVEELLNTSVVAIISDYNDVAWLWSVYWSCSAVYSISAAVNIASKLLYSHLPLTYNVWGSMGVTVCITNHDALDVLKSHSQVWSINTDVSASINGPSRWTKLKYNI